MRSRSFSAKRPKTLTTSGSGWVSSVTEKPVGPLTAVRLPPGAHEHPATHFELGVEDLGAPSSGHMLGDRLAFAPTHGFGATADRPW